MSKIRTLTELQSALDDGFAWRLKEIADLQIQVKGSAATRQKTAIRAGVALLYAHWEGFVKRAAESYIEFVAAQGVALNDLKTCFQVLGFKSELHELIESREPGMLSKAMELITGDMTKPARRLFRSYVNTESNLSSDLFLRIAVSIGIDIEPYSTKANLIDLELLKRRNGIAHGEYLEIEHYSYKTLSDEVIGLLRTFQNDVLNAAVTGSYKRVA